MSGHLPRPGLVPAGDRRPSRPDSASAHVLDTERVKVGLSEVAARAGVSVRTVANVVADHPRVRPETRARVQAAIDELGYMPNVSARRLARGRAGTIAFAISSVAVPFFAELAARLIDAADERGYHVLIEQTHGAADRERTAIARREAGLVDGVVLMTRELTASQILQYRSDAPLVLMGEASTPVGIDHVMIDNVAAADLATTELLHGGVQRVGFLGAGEDDRSRWIARGRLAGWQQALERHGLAADPDLVFATPGWTFQAGFDAVDRALRAGVRFEALFCCEDMLALGALAALAAHGIAVPDEVAVTGWDDIATARYAIPALTSVSPDRDALIGTALDCLVDQIEHDGAGGRHRIAPHSLAVRASTRSG